MAKRYDFAMNRHSKGRKKRKDRLEGLDFQTVAVFKDPKSSAFGDDEDKRLGMITPGELDLDSSLSATMIDPSAGLNKPKTHIGDELGGITDRISKVWK